MKKVKNIIIFVSGTGTNMANIIDYFKEKSDINICFRVFSNKKDCLAMKKAKEAGVNKMYFSKKEFNDGEIFEILDKINPDLIILAGFLLRVPHHITRYFENQIINVHPSLLPKFGGKGMYGSNVHKAVIEAGETKSGITFHYVNENYDEGNIIEQHECKINPTDTWEDLQVKIQQLEQEHFPKIIEKLLTE